MIAACFGDAKLSTSRQAVIETDVDPVFVGSATIGGSATTTITLRPQDATSDDTITSIIKSCGSDFELIPANAGVGERVYCSAGFGGSGYGEGACVPVTYSFDVAFHPQGAGAASCALTVNYVPTGGGPAATRKITLNATGIAATYALSVTPPQIQFSDHPVGSTSSSTTVTIKNIGATAMTVNGSNSNGSNFSVASTGGSVFASQALAVGAQASYAVSCTPQTLGPITGALTFSSMAGTHSVQLGCNGIGASSLTISPVPANFASTLVGRAPTDVTVTITNNGAPTTLAVSLAASNPQLTFAAGGNPNGIGLGSGSSTTARLQFAATTEHPAGSLGTLTVGYTGGAPRNITINGTALVGELGWAPAEVDFGPVCIGATASLPVTVYASAAGSVDVTSVTGAAAPFNVTRTPGTLQGNHGNTLDFIATVNPTAPGELTDSFTLNTNLPTVPTRSIPLKALVLPSGLTPTPDLVHFGPSRVGMTTAAKTINLSNCGTTPINITAVRIDGASAAEFALVSPENPLMPLQQMETVKYLVVMSPRQNGTKAAQLVIEYDGGTVVADLDGNGFGGDGGDLVDRGTYYACNAGHGSPVSLAPLALALLVLRRRRLRRA